MKTIRRRKIHTPLSLDTLYPVLQTIYAARGIQSAEELQYTLKDLLHDDELLNSTQAAEALAQAIAEKKRLLVIGDFDADGATSSALAVHALRSFGADVHYLVPNRFTYGYGLTPGIVDLAAQQYQPDWIITVDNGIASHAGVAQARHHGMHVLITDHHLPASTLPDADIIVNPNQHGDTFPSKSLAGVGVMFYVLLALRRVLRAQDWFQKSGITEPNLADYLDLVALGTIADVVPLDKNNRILVQQGLLRIRAGKVRPGIRALLTLAKKNLLTLTSRDLAFGVAPRLNAAGRLADMSLGIACLLSDDPIHAETLAQELDGLNQERQFLTSEMQAEAQVALSDLNEKNSNLPAGICLFSDTWHEGVIGVLAGRLKDTLHRPVIIFAQTEDGSLKGSGRSIPGLHLRDTLDRIATQHPDLLDRFGGHAMAAGLALAREKFTTFSTIFAELVKEQLTPADLEAIIETDGELSDKDFSCSLAETLRFAGPFGQHFPEPSFDGIFHLVEQRIVGERHLKCRLQHPQSEKCFDAICFNIDLKNWPNHRAEYVQIVYRLDINVFQQTTRLQLLIEQIEAVADVR